MGVHVCNMCRVRGRIGSHPLRARRSMTPQLRPAGANDPTPLH